MKVWVVQLDEGYYEPQDVLGVYVSLEAAMRHHEGDWVINGDYADLRRPTQIAAYPMEVEE